MKETTDSETSASVWWWNWSHIWSFHCEIRIDDFTPTGSSILNIHPFANLRQQIGPRDFRWISLDDESARILEDIYNTLLTLSKLLKERIKWSNQTSSNKRCIVFHSWIGKFWDIFALNANNVSDHVSFAWLMPVFWCSYHSICATKLNIIFLRKFSEFSLFISTK